MVPVVKDYNDVPARLNYSVEPLASTFGDLVSNKNNHKFKTRIYRDGSITKLKEIYHDKCAYCETVTAAGAELRVDHYRPKDKVKEDPLHLTGYYWLSYEWSNLILACEKCNGSKSNKFPIDLAGQRCYNPTLVPGTSDIDKTTFSPAHASLSNERPMLVNPEIDSDLTDWFIFLPSGEIREMPGNTRMQQTIDICKLNRTPLVLDRKKIFDDLINKIEKFLNDFIGDSDRARLTNRINDLFDDLFSMADRRKKYSRFCYFLYLKFNLFSRGKFGAKANALVTKLYLNHRMTNLGF